MSLDVPRGKSSETYVVADDRAVNAFAVQCTMKLFWFDFFWSIHFPRYAATHIFHEDRKGRVKERRKNDENELSQYS